MGLEGATTSVRGKAYKVHERVFPLYTNVNSWPIFKFFLKMTPSPAERWCLRTKFYPLAILDTWGDVSLKIWVLEGLLTLCVVKPTRSTNVFFPYTLTLNLRSILVFFLKMTPSPAERWCLRTKFRPLGILDTWTDVS